MRSIAVPMLLLSAALAQSQAYAADVTPKGAKELKHQILSNLPDSMAKNSGAITVRPRQNAYELRIDAIALFGLEALKFTKTMGIKPIVSLLRPLEGGLWQFDQAGGIDVQGSSGKKAAKTDFHVSVESYSSSGIYDPTITYFQSGKFTSDGIRILLKSAKGSTDIALDKADSTIESKRDGDSTITMASISSFTGLKEVVDNKVIDKAGAGPKAVRVTVRSASGESGGKAEGVVYKPLQQILPIVARNWGKPKLDEADKTLLIQLFRSNFPLFKTATQSVSYNDLQVDTPQGPFTTKRFAMTSTIDGIRNGAHFSFGLEMTEPRAPTAPIPAAYTPLLPDTIAVNVALPSVNAADGINYVIDHVDFDPAHQMTPPEKSELGRQFFPDGTVTITYDGTHIGSSLYDISIDGKTSFTLTGTDKPLADVTIKVRDFDKAVAYLQAHTKEEPKFAQAAFFLLMAKGFAENQADNIQVWHVETDRTGQVLVNGRPFKVPGQQ